MNQMDLTAGIAGICTTLSFLPQVIKVYRTKHTKDLSLPMYVIFSSGVLLWTYYGVLVDSWPIIAANGVTFVLSLCIMIMKAKYR